MELRVQGIASEDVEGLRRGKADANGQEALVRPATGLDPCRHCLGIVEQGDEKLVLAYRPFSTSHPYAEIGPIFLHRRECERYDAPRLPAWFDFLDPAIVRGYGEDDWIRYETGDVVQGADLGVSAQSILRDETICYVHIRSKYNCFQCRVDRV